MKLVTTLGEFSHDQHGMILPHEHVFVDLRTPDVEGHGQAETDSVVRLMTPQLEQARASGVTALVECTPLGVGRRVDLVKAVSAAANLPVVCPGIYREPWVPDVGAPCQREELYEWMLGELQGEIEGTACAPVSLRFPREMTA
jgi:phosphotriesterase-related protein